MRIVILQCGETNTTWQWPFPSMLVFTNSDHSSSEDHYYYIKSESGKVVGNVVFTLDQLAKDVENVRYLVLEL